MAFSIGPFLITSPALRIAPGAPSYPARYSQKSIPLIQKDRTGDWQARRTGGSKVANNESAQQVFECSAQAGVVVTIFYNHMGVEAKAPLLAFSLADGAGAGGWPPHFRG